MYGLPSLWKQNKNRGEGSSCSNKINGVFNYVLACYMSDHYRQWSQTCWLKSNYAAHLRHLTLSYSLPSLLFPHTKNGKTCLWEFERIKWVMQVICEQSVDMAVMYDRIVFQCPYCSPRLPLDKLQIISRVFSFDLKV